jgi:glutaconate CoA-transferase subunit A
MKNTTKIVDLDGLVSQISSGDLMVLPNANSGDFSGASMVTTRALIRRGIKDLHLLGAPALNFQADLLIGAGCVGTVEAGSTLLYEYGPASRFVAAQRKGTITVVDSTCPAIYAGLQAGAKGIPFMVVRGIIGSDLVRHREARGDWCIVLNPFGEDDPIVAVRAIRPNVALFHAPLADRQGNVWIGQRDVLATMARAAYRTLVTFEDFYDGNLFESEQLSPATIPSTFVAALSHQPKGSWPLNCGDRYGDDVAHLKEYARLAKTDEGFADYLARHVMERKPQEAALHV